MAFSVKELVKDKGMLNGIPQRYIQQNQEPSFNYNFSPHDNTTIPLVDMQLLIEGNSKNDVELDKLHSICKEWGIFQVVNHGVKCSVMEKLKKEIEEFYNLPLEEKMRYKVREGEVEGYGQTQLSSYEDKNNNVDWADRLYILINPLHMRKSHIFPLLPSSLRNALETYFAEMEKLAMTLLGLMGEALKMEKKDMKEMFENGMRSMRTNYYPPCPKPELVCGFRSHSDATGITILKQINEVDGLEVKKNGIWIPVKVLPDSFVVNIGDTLEILSNGGYNSIEHRVRVNSEKERISIAMFFNPKLEAYVGPSHSLITQQNPPLFKTISMQNYIKDFFSHKLNGKSFLDQMKIIN